MVLSKRERLQATLRKQAVDRPPFGFWAHFPDADQHPERLAAETARFAKNTDVDFIKSCPNGYYCVLDWGVEVDSGAVKFGGFTKVLKPSITESADWRKVKRLDIRSGAYGRELRHVKQLVEALAPDIPVLATIFAPTTIARKLAGPDYLAHHIEHPDLVGSALAEIAATVRAFAEEAIRIGCAGVYFAVQEATYDKQSVEDYRRFAEPHDRESLAGANGGWLNVVHMHGNHVMFDVLKDYPVTALNWHIGEDEPSLAAYAAEPNAKPVVGGMSGDGLTKGDLVAVVADIEAALEATDGGRGLLLSPPCVIAHPFQISHLVRVGEHIKALGGERAKSTAVTSS